MSGLSRTPGKRVWDNIPTGVRIPPSPPFYGLQASFNYPDLLRFTSIYLKKSLTGVPVLFPTGSALSLLARY